MTTRPAAVAGQFYPADPDALSALVDGFLAAAPRAAPALAYVVPHAGLRYSGPTAACVYSGLTADRVVLIGPSHRVPLTGAAVPVSRTWSGPLGPSIVDTEAAWALVEAGHAHADEAPHADEHAIEVQLPFLRRVAPDAPVLPVAIGESTSDDVAALVEAVAGTPGTVVVCSTDLSHYLDEAAAVERDGHTTRAVLDLAPERIGRLDACGAYALRGLVAWAGRRGLAPQLLHRCTSADTTGDRTRVVGYAAFAFRLDAQR